MSVLDATENPREHMTLTHERVTVSCYFEDVEDLEPRELHALLCDITDAFTHQFVELKKERGGRA